MKIIKRSSILFFVLIFLANVILSSDWQKDLTVLGFYAVVKGKAIPLRSKRYPKVGNFSYHVFKGYDYTTFHKIPIEDFVEDFEHLPELNEGDFLVLYGNVPSGRENYVFRYKSGPVALISSDIRKAKTVWVPTEELWLFDEFFSFEPAPQIRGQDVYILRLQERVPGGIYFIRIKEESGNFRFTGFCLEESDQHEREARESKPSSVEITMSKEEAPRELESINFLEKVTEEPSSDQKRDIRDLNATQIKLEEVKLLDSHSYFPCWSPDGNKILYTRGGYSGGLTMTDIVRGSIWMINPDGSNKERITDGYDAAWSPDGKRIAYKKREVDKRKIAIFDLAEKKEYIIYVEKNGFRNRLFSGVDYNRTQWSKDGKMVFFVDREKDGGGQASFLNLDDLSWKKGRLYGWDYKGGSIETKICRLVNSYAKKAPTHPRFIIIDRGGISAKNKEGEISFEICLLGGRFRSPELSPDFTKIVFVKPKWEEALSWDLYADAMFKGKKPKKEPNSICIARIVRSPASHVKYYEIPIGLKNGIKRGDKLGIHVPKINPLNNKIIGYLGRKGTVLVESVTENKALARTYIIDKDFDQNDIAVKGASFGYIKEISIEEKTKEVEVLPEIIGKLKEGLYIEKKEVIPPRVAIKGSEINILNVDAVKTSTVNISSWTQSGEVEANIILHAPYLKFATSQTKAKVRITIAEGEVPPVRVVEDISPPKLIKEVKPIYPEIAMKKRIEGVVILEVTTDSYGKVQNTKVLKSIPLLDQAAIDAVEQWMYEPTIIDHSPRGVISTITVAFKMPRLIDLLKKARHEITLSCEYLDRKDKKEAKIRINDARVTLKSAAGIADGTLKEEIKFLRGRLWGVRTMIKLSSAKVSKDQMKEIMVGIMNLEQKLR